MELIQIDSIELEPLETCLACLLKVIGSCFWDPIRGFVANQPSLGRNDEIWRIRIEGLRDNTLGNFGPVAVGGIDQVYAEIDRALEYALGFLAVGWIAP